MKKNGFSLMEVLIAMGIIGVIAACLMPAVNNLRPDGDKMEVMKIVNKLAELNQELLESGGTYVSTVDLTMSGQAQADLTGADLGFISAGLFQTHAPLENSDFYKDPANNPCQGTTKYACLVAEALNIPEADRRVAANPSSITLPNKTRIEFNYNSPNNVNDYKDTKVRLTITLKPKEDASKNCAYGDANCRKPNQFKFIINNDGIIRGADEDGFTDYLAQAFMLNEENMQSRQKDLECVKKLEKNESCEED